MHYERHMRHIGRSVNPERMVPIARSPTGQALNAAVGVIIAAYGSYSWTTRPMVGNSEAQLISS